MFVNPNPQWASFCEIVGAPELAQAPFHDPEARLDNADELERRLRAALARFTVSDLVAECQRRRLAVTPVLDPRGVFESEQLRARHWFAEVQHPKAGRLEHTGTPYSIAGHPAVIGPAPLLGGSARVEGVPPA
jgi:crotonobetainyl-CoA:carnitine CoA-transferase CaiB-like acyl-CoA transferase